MDSARLVLACTIWTPLTKPSLLLAYHAIPTVCVRMEITSALPASQTHSFSIILPAKLNAQPVLNPFQIA